MHESEPILETLDNELTAALQVTNLEADEKFAILEACLDAVTIEADRVMDKVVEETRLECLDDFREEFYSQMKQIYLEICKPEDRCLPWYKSEDGIWPYLSEVKFS